jgi:hypothetical protein
MRIIDTAKSVTKKDCKELELIDLFNRLIAFLDAEFKLWNQWWKA